MRSLLRASAFMTISFCALSHSFAYAILNSDGVVVRWPTTAFHYELNDHGAPGVASDLSIDAIRAAIDSWNDVECSALNMSYDSLTDKEDTSISTNVLDGVNRMSWHDQWNLGKYVLAVTHPAYDRKTGEIVEADIGFNGQVKWAANNKTRGAYDIQGIAAHELGHAFGLRHVANGNKMAEKPTMSPEYHDQAYKLTDDDKLGLCFLYPNAVQTMGCATEADCPRINEYTNNEEKFVAQSTCLSNMCQNAVPQSSATFLGKSCKRSSDCGDNLSCIDAGSLGKICANHCTLGFDNCAAGLVCVVTTDGPHCVDAQVKDEFINCENNACKIGLGREALAKEMQKDEESQTLMGGCSNVSASPSFLFMGLLLVLHALRSRDVAR